MDDIIGGINPVLEALKARGRAFQRIFISRNRGGAAVERIIGLARELDISVQRVEAGRLDRLYGRKGHQGVVARVGAYEYRSIEDILDRAPADRALVLILDGVQDPMNLGSLIRSAEAAGAAGVFLPRERSAPVTEVALKAAAGAAEFVDVARVVNLVRTLDRLKEAGFWIVGTEAEAERSVFDLEFGQKTGLVVGGEGKGLSRLVRENCDELASIPMRGRISSLNASVAGGLAMFEYVRQTGRL